MMQNIEIIYCWICCKNAQSTCYKRGSVPHCASYHKLYHSSKWKRLGHLQLSECLWNFMWLCLRPAYLQVYWWWVASRIWRTSQQLSPLTRQPSCWWQMVIIEICNPNTKNSQHAYRDVWLFNSLRRVGIEWFCYLNALKVNPATWTSLWRRVWLLGSCCITAWTRLQTVLGSTTPR